MYILLYTVEPSLVWFVAVGQKALKKLLATPWTTVDLSLKYEVV